MTKILVTGASGFIGRNVLIASPRDWDIVAVYSGSDDFPAFVNALGLTHVSAVRCDLVDRAAVQRLASVHGDSFDACLYLAANVSIPLSVEQPLVDLQANAVALLNVLELMRFGRFVYMSSGAVYDGLTGVMGPEVVLRPRIPYAISKLASEQYVQFFHRRRETIGSYVILRFFGAFGPYEPSRKIYTKLVRSLALERASEFKVTGDGKNLIDAMYISDAVDGILRVMRSDVADMVLDFASASPISIDDLVTRAGKVFHVPVKISHEGRTEEYIEFQADPEPMATLLGFRANVSLEDGLSRFHQHLKRQYQGAK